MSVSTLQAEIVLKLTGKSFQGEELQLAWKALGNYVPPIVRVNNGLRNINYPQETTSHYLSQFNSKLDQLNIGAARSYMNVKISLPTNVDVPTEQIRSEKKTYPRNATKSEGRHRRMIIGKNSYNGQKYVYVNKSKKHQKKMERRMSHLPKSTKKVVVDTNATTETLETLDEKLDEELDSTTNFRTVDSDDESESETVVTNSDTESFNREQ